MSEVTARHPGDQTMAAFAEGRLAPDERAAVVAHVGECEECRFVLIESARFEREEQQIGRTSVTYPWWLAAAAVVVLAATALLLLQWNERHRLPLARLIAAAPREHRSVPARLSGFPWARLQAPSRGNAITDPADLKLHGAAGEVLEKSADSRTAEARHASGVAYLLIGRRADSIAALNEAARSANTAQAWNDLAAARYTRAVVEDAPLELPEALADVDHALRLDPNDVEAHFNRALILERLGLRTHARDAWQRYLQLDGASRWSVEAREHLNALQSSARPFDPKMIDRAPPEQLVHDFPEKARRESEGTLLSDWGDAVLAHDDARAAAILARARTIADALRAQSGERLLDDAVAVAERASGPARDELAQAHHLYRAAGLAYSKRNNAPAEADFRKASELFARAGSPMAGVAAFYAASAAFNQNRVAEARDELMKLLERTDATRHLALAAQVYYQLTVCANAAGDWGTSVREADAAAALFRKLGERRWLAILDGTAAMSLEVIGDSDAAWGRCIQSFTHLSDLGDQQRLRTTLHSAAETLAARDHAEAALAMIGLIADDAHGDPAQIANCQADRARFAMRNGDVALARQAIASARAAERQVADPALRELIGAQIDLADGTIASLDRSISVFTKRGMKVDLADAYLQRARALRDAGDPAAALDDYGRGLAELEKQRATIAGPELQMRFLDLAGRLIDDSIELRLSRGDPAGAFAIADGSRKLLEGAASKTPMAVAPGLAVVEYALLPHTLVAFCVTRDGISARETRIERNELAAMINAFAERIRGRAPLAEITADGAALHRLLIEPLHLDGIREVVIVPDRQLHALPFAALWDSATKQFLAEELTIRFAPSAVTDEESLPPLTPALVVADPPTPSFPPLPATHVEAQQIAALHGAAQLTGAEATRSAFTAAAARSALIHFAGHADSDTGSSYAALLFAANDGDSGVMSSGDVARLRLERKPLVVLAACGTFRGDPLHVAGMSSLARSFLLAGARGVVGTLWEIDDDVSAQLFLRLHERLRGGAPPARALREAQLDLLRSANARLAHPATWAAAESLNH